MPNGLLFDALKAGGAAAKMIFDFAKSIVGNLVGGAVGVLVASDELTREHGL